MYAERENHVRPRTRHEDNPAVIEQEQAARDDPAAHGPLSIDAALVRRLIAAQFPQWADRVVTPVEPGGVDNRTFRLGDDMTVRLPSDEGYAPQVDKEHRWLPVLAPHLPLPIPVPLAKGLPADGYPFDWSVYRWLDGENASIERIDDLNEFAVTLAAFLGALQRIDPANGPPPGQHSAYRGGPLATYDNETRRAIGALTGSRERDSATAVWDAALAATGHDPPVWFHGDVSPGNLLLRHGRLACVIDFGCSGVGDPACDMAIAWTLFSGGSREAFRSALPVDSATWARGRGWALWKALITMAEHLNSNPGEAATARRVIDTVVADHERST
ncbi:MAG: aminoglycoside phosphotransferase family protein [Geodermatophilaceae bacterium]|nr:aminoglycoside phosphotransferase family protein [Geodermatophilaceae bacterium]